MYRYWSTISALVRSVAPLLYCFDRAVDEQWMSLKHIKLINLTLIPNYC